MQEATLSGGYAGAMWRLLMLVVLGLGCVQAEQRKLEPVLGSWDTFDYRGPVRSIVREGSRIEIDAAQTRAQVRGPDNFSATVVLDAQRRTLTMTTGSGRVKQVNTFDVAGCPVSVVLDAVSEPPDSTRLRSETRRRCAPGGWVIWESEWLNGTMLVERQIRWSADHRERVITGPGLRITERFNPKGDLVYQDEEDLNAGQRLVTTSFYVYDDHGNWVNKAEKIVSFQSGRAKAPVMSYTARQLTYYR